MSAAHAFRLLDGNPFLAIEQASTVRHGWVGEHHVHLRRRAPDGWLHEHHGGPERRFDLPGPPGGVTEPALAEVYQGVRTPWWILTPREPGT